MTYGPEGLTVGKAILQITTLEIPSPVNISASLTLTYRANSKGEEGVDLPGQSEAVYGLLLPQACVYSPGVRKEEDGAAGLQ